jgi:ABC-type molybdate transport system substrate-binding protein
MNPAGVTVFCDPTLAPALRALRGGPEIAVLSAPASLMLAQLARHTRCDVLVTLATAMDQAVQRNLVRPATRLDGFSNPLVLAGNPNVKIANAVVALTDDTPASGLDGRAVLAANDLNPRIIKGAANTDDVAFLVRLGAADLGLMYATDANAHPPLQIIATMQAAPALTRFAAAQNAKAVSPDAQDFLALLRSPAAAETLSKAGLMVSA